MRVPRLRTRLTLWFAASILLILSPFLAGMLALEWRNMRGALDHHLQEDLEVAAEMLAWHGDELVWRSRRTTDTGYDGGPQRWVEAFALDGRTLFLRGAPANGVVRAAFSAPIDGPEGFRTLRVSSGGYLRVLTEQRRVGAQDVWLRVARPEDDLRADLERLTVILAIAAPLAVIAAALSGYVISGRALLPLGRMAERARFISADRLSERLPIANAHDELGQLAVVFNETFSRLETSFDRLKAFTADVSHELRTPLTAIRSVGEVALQEPRTTAEYQDTVASMLEETDRLGRVIDTLLLLARWESGRVEAGAEQIDLAAVTWEVAAQLGVLAEERGVRIDVALSHELPARCHPVMARQAVINVVDNAIKFTRENTTVHIWARRTAAEQHLVVDDAGPGIPVELRQRVMEPFYRLDRDRSRGGAGLGLALVKRAVSLNRGRLEIATSPAGGARIVLALPSA